MKEIGIAFGILASSIKDQLQEQGLQLNETFEKEEKIRKSINMLGFHGYLSDSQIKLKFNKLMKEIIKIIEK